MGNRSLRVNELLKREVSQYIHRRLQSETVGVTVTDVESTRDYKSATVFFSMITDAENAATMESLLNKHAQSINQHLRRSITLRNIPRVRFKFDNSMERGSRILHILDEIDDEQKGRAS